MATTMNEIKPQKPLSAPLKLPASPAAPIPTKQDAPPAKPKDPHFGQTGFLSAARRSGCGMEFVLNSVVGR